MNTEPQIGDILVFIQKETHLVKRMASFPIDAKKMDDGYYVLGDNFGVSMDSRNFGTITKKSVRGQVRTILFSISEKNDIDLVPKKISSKQFTQPDN
ncbi:hypothetical protein SAMN02745866_02971 [Alteromonadaceae bacterium Bs31]|nr:hypothetical protein SAMN02745866_02971 [Alteromonadaceae bacterium Bs31]